MHGILRYDGSFEGFLTAVFYVYEHKLKSVEITRAANTSSLFGDVIDIYTEEQKAQRVWKALSEKLSAQGLHSLYSSYLADTLQEENNMLAFIQYAFTSTKNIERDYSNFAVMRVQEVERMVSRERHRMKAFIRFKLTKDNIYFANVEPDFNVLPLIKTHFEKRYADQQWLIYDNKRNYGLYYNLQTVETVELSIDDTVNPNTGKALWMDEQEELYQTLWQQYFKSVNITSRKNVKLHLQHVPRRYWQYLSEKGGKR